MSLTAAFPAQASDFQGLLISKPDGSILAEDNQTIEKSKTKEQLEKEAQSAKNRALEKLTKIDGGEKVGG